MKGLPNRIHKIWAEADEILGFRISIYLVYIIVCLTDTNTFSFTASFESLEI